MNRAALQQMKLTKPGKWLASASGCLVIVCSFALGQVQPVNMGEAARPSITLDAPTGSDLQEQNFDAQGHILRPAPANFRRLGELKAGQVGSIHALTLRFAETLTITHIKSTRDFRIEQGGSCMEGNVYLADTTCTLLVRFTPVGPGRRLGQIVVSHSGSTSATTFALSAFSFEPVISFTPAQITTVPGTFSSGAGTLKGATYLAIDGGDILYIADVGNNLLKKTDSTGTITSITPFFATPVSITVDSFGIVWGLSPSGSFYYFLLFEPWATQGADGATYVASTCTVSAPCGLGSVGMSNPANISIDEDDNLFMEEGTQGALEMPVAGYSGGNGTLDLWHLLDEFAYFTGTASPFAVDANDNLYTALEYSAQNTCFILKQPLYGTEIGDPTTIRVAGGLKCGYSGDGGQGAGAEISSTIGQIAFDAAGNLYFTDAGNQRVRRIDALTGIIRTIAGNGTVGYTGDGGLATKATLHAPAGLSVDSQGQVYVISNSAATGTAQVVRKVGVTGDLIFPSTTDGVASATLIVNVANTGNETLSFVRDTVAGADPGDFLIDANTTNCNFAAGNYLYSGQNCQIGVIFRPAAVGTRTATINLVDNTVNGVNKITLSGTGVAAAKVQFTAPPASAELTSETKITVSVKVTSGYATPTGKVTFSIDGKVVGSSTLASGLASFAVGTLASGMHTVLASYSGDKDHAAAKASENLTVSK